CELPPQLIRRRMTRSATGRFGCWSAHNRAAAPLQRRLWPQSSRNYTPAARTRENSSAYTAERGGRMRLNEESAWLNDSAASLLRIPACDPRVDGRKDKR